jgi:predicted nucleic acid-binding protein
MMDNPGSAPLQCVLDASVSIKWFVDEENSDLARALLGQMTDAATRFHIPNLFYVELANVLWKCVQRQRLSAESARDAVSAIRALTFVSHPMELLIDGALDIAMRHGVTAYDASYVALAESLGLPMITADDKLQRKLANSHDIRLLTDVVR